MIDSSQLSFKFTMCNMQLTARWPSQSCLITNCLLSMIPSHSRPASSNRLNSLRQDSLLQRSLKFPWKSSSTSFLKTSTPTTMAVRLNQVAINLTAVRMSLGWSTWSHLWSLTSKSMNSKRSSIAKPRAAATTEISSPSMQEPSGSFPTLPTTSLKWSVRVERLPMLWLRLPPFAWPQLSFSDYKFKYR